MRHLRSASLSILVAVLLMGLLALGCSKKEETPDPIREKIKSFLLSEAPASMDVTSNINLDDKIMILGYDYSPKPISREKPYTVTFYYKVLGNISGDYRFFGHLEPVDGEHYREQLDHLVMNGKYPTSSWKPGDIIKDVHRANPPKAFPGTEGVLWGGFFRDDFRMKVKTTDASLVDAGGRARLGTLKIEENIEELPEIAALKTAEYITIDGKLDEADWARARETGPFVNVSGERKVKPLTNAKMLWDDTYLYIAFICEDRDIWTTYTKRDDPLYRQETIEVMINAGGLNTDYYEIQVNAANVLYDAYFPLRRQGMEIEWDSGVKSAVHIEGTLNKRDDIDRKWTVEMAIPLKVIKDAPQIPPQPGSDWRINLYRMERPQKRGTIASMWSPTLVGDFHMLNRFGKVIFLETEPQQGDVPIDKTMTPAKAPKAAPAQVNPGLKDRIRKAAPKKTNER